MTTGFCTLAIHAPYRRRARQLLASAKTLPWTILTDVPKDFVDFPARTIRQNPTGPMAIDYLTLLPPTGNRRGAAAYHDKRFALLATLEEFDTAVYVDADSRFDFIPAANIFPPGISVLPVVRKNVFEHLTTCGSWRLPAFIELARYLTGNGDILTSAQWCHEALIAITKDGNESKFFEAWAFAAKFLQEREIYSGEGGVIGLSASYAGWSVDYKAATVLGNSIKHESGGPKQI